VRLQSRSQEHRRFHVRASLLGAKDADGKVIVLSPRSEVAIGEPIF